MGCFAKFIKDRNSKAGNMGVPPYFVFDFCSDSGFPHYRFFSWFWFGPPLFAFLFSFNSIKNVAYDRFEL